MTTEIDMRTEAYSVDWKVLSPYDPEVDEYGWWASGGLSWQFAGVPQFDVSSTHYIGWLINVYDGSWLVSHEFTVTTSLKKVLKITVTTNYDNTAILVYAYIDNELLGIASYSNDPDLDVFWVGFKLEAGTSLYLFTRQTTNWSSDLADAIANGTFTYMGSWFTLGNTPSWIKPHEFLTREENSVVRFATDYATRNPTGTAWIKKIISQTATSIMDGGGNAVIIADKTANLSTAQSQLRKFRTIRDNKYEQGLFKGEINKIEIKTDTIVFHLESEIKKLNKQVCGFNSIVYSGTISQVDGDTIYDNGSSEFTSVTTNDILVTNDASLTTVKVVPVSYTVEQPLGTVIAAGDTCGSIQSIHRNEYLSMHINTYEKFHAVFKYTIWLKTGTIITSFPINIQMRTAHRGNVNMLTDPPSFNAYNYSTSSWDSEYLIDAGHGFTTSKDGSGETWSCAALNSSHVESAPLFNHTFYPNGSNVYLHATGNTENGYTEYEAKFYIYSGLYGTLLAPLDNALEFYDIYSELTVDTDQVPTLQHYPFLTVTDSSLEIKAVGAVTAEMPQSDALCVGDTYYIANSVIYAVTKALANTSFSSDISISNGYYGIAQDLTDTYISTFLDTVKKLYGIIYYIDYDTDTILIRDNRVSTGLTLTKADVVDYYGGQFYFGYKSEEKESIIVNGRNGIRTTYTNGSDYTVENANTLGNETIVITNHDVDTQREIDKIATTMIDKYSTSHVEINVVLDYNNPPQDYSSIAVGKSINFVDAELGVNVNNLVITSMVYNTDNGLHHMNLTLESDIL